MQNYGSVKTPSSYRDILESTDLGQEPVEAFTLVYKDPKFDNELIKKEFLNLFLDAEKKNFVSINEEEESQLYGVVIGEASKRKKLYERLHESFEGFNTKSFTETISKVLINQRDRSSLLGAEKRDSFDFDKFKITVLSFGDYFVAIIYQSAFRSAGATKLEKLITKMFKGQNFLDASVIRNNIQGELDKEVENFLVHLPESRSLLGSLLRLIFMFLFCSIAFNKAYEWDVQNIINSDSALQGVPLKIDRNLVMNSYFISGSVPSIKII